MFRLEKRHVSYDCGRGYGLRNTMCPKIVVEVIA